MLKKWQCALTLTQVLYCLVLLTLSIDYWFIHPLQAQSLFFIWVLKCLPLFLFIPGIVRGYPRWLAWLCFVILFYFISSVVSAWLSPYDWINYVKVILCVLLFSSSMFTVRWYYRDS